MRAAGAAIRRRGRRRRAVVLVAFAVLAVGAGIAIHTTHALRPVELNSLDLRFKIRGNRKPPHNVIVVGIDDETFNTKPYPTWPFKRGLHADVIEHLRQDGARVIAYDVQFTQPSPFPSQDAALLNAVNDAGPVLVLATTEVAKNGNTDVLGNPRKDVEATGAKIGDAIIPADSDNVRRRVPYSYQGLPSFAVAAAEEGTHRTVPRGPFGASGALIDYHGPGGTLRYVPFWRVAQGKFKPGTFRNAYVVVGAVAPVLQDVAPTSTSGGQLESGPEIQAEAISTILDGFPLRPVPGWITVLVIVAFGLAPGLLSLRLSSAWTFFGSVLIGGAYAGASMLAFAGGHVTEVVSPLATLTIGLLGTLAAVALIEAFERQRVRDMFARFVPESVVDAVLDSTEGTLRLGGSARECTALFSDLRGFTTYSESRDPEYVIGVLNEYLSEMTESILEHGGTLVAFMGDGIFAVFGAPLDQPDHRDRAVSTARDMLARLDRFNERKRAGGSDEHFRMGVGIHTGRVMVGNVGSTRRLEYTAIGDAVNTASRIEGMTKGTPYDMLVTDSTVQGLAQRHSDLVFVDELEVRGRQAKVKLWGLARAEPPSEAADNEASMEGTSPSIPATS